MEQLNSRLPCRLDGRECPGVACPFWLSGECLLSEIDMRGRPDVAAWLTELRTELERKLERTDALRRPA